MSVIDDEIAWASLILDWRLKYRPLLGPWRLRPLRLLATMAIEWKPQDLWVGAFWKRSVIADGELTSVQLWICIIPCVPIHVWWYRRRRGRT